MKHDINLMSLWLVKGLITKLRQIEKNIILIQSKELIPYPLLLQREGELTNFSKSLSFLALPSLWEREGFRVS